MVLKYGSFSRGEDRTVYTVILCILSGLVLHVRFVVSWCLKQRVMRVLMSMNTDKGIYSSDFGSICVFCSQLLYEAVYSVGV